MQVRNLGFYNFDFHERTLGFVLCVKTSGSYKEVQIYLDFDVKN